MYLLGEFFTPALGNGFSLEFEWQQVSSSLQESSQYSDRSHWCSSLEGNFQVPCLFINLSVTVPRASITIDIIVSFMFHSFCYFQVIQSLYKSFADCTKSTNYNWCYRHFHVPQLFKFPSKLEVLMPLFTFFQFHSVVCWDSKVHNSVSFFFVVVVVFDYYKFWSSGQDLVTHFYLKIPKAFVCFILFGQILGCAYTICSYVQTSTSCTIPSESPSPPNRASFYILSVLICCIHLLCDWSFRLFHHITYYCCFDVVSPYGVVLCCH